MHEDLSDRIDNSISDLISGHDGLICLIDPPGHPNVGDSAIFLGELDFLGRRFPTSDIFYYDVDSYSPAADEFIEKASVILIHGGGNFGDLWPQHHRLRMRILERFRHKRIIQFPQSIHFDDRSGLRETARIIGGQRDFTLFVRDESSLAFARSQFDCAVRLAPDMAFALAPIRRAPPVADYFCLLRTDKEAVADHAAVLDLLWRRGVTIESGDWLDRSPTLGLRLERRLLALTRRQPALMAPLRSMMLKQRERHARERLEYGIAMLSRGATVVADRLHAHILACMLGIPNVILDSYGGKISAFHDTWTSGAPGVRFVSSTTEILGAAA